MIIPSFCPNPRCQYHQTAPADHKWYQKRGSYETLSAGRISRFRCNSCTKGFSERTLSIDYFTKKLVDYQQLTQLISSGMGLRQVSRLLNLSVGTLTNRIERFARQSIALNESITATHALQEQVTADEYETFSVSQYFPEFYHLLVGSNSQFLYFFTHMGFKRKGRTDEGQKLRKKQLYEKVVFERGAQTRSFSQVMDKLGCMSGPDHCITLATDEKRAYFNAINRNTTLAQMRDEGRFLHHRTPSTAPRTFSSRLFGVNYMEREIRKDIAAQVRETVRFNRHVCGGLFRLCCYAFYHNFEKRYRINDPVAIDRRHYQLARIDENRVKQRLLSIYTLRVFVTREEIDGFARNLWFKRIPTPLKTKDEYIQNFVAA